MAQPVVLVTFSCRSGETEKQALAAAVGAVQARALIRLRRLPEPQSENPTEPELRMRKEYVAPTEKDVLGADAVILAGSAATPLSQWADFLKVLRGLRDAGRLSNKVAAEIGLSCIQDLGFQVVHMTSQDATALGRDVVEAVRARTAEKENL